MNPYFKKLKSIREPRQRVAKLLELFRTQTPSEIAETLSFLFQDTSRLPAIVSQVHLDLVRYRHLLSSMGYGLISDIYQAAYEKNFVEVCLFLRSEKSNFFDEEHKPEGFLKQLSSLTLGERRSLGRKVTRAKIEFLLFDSDPLVIRELLLNPKVIEKDVIRMGSRHQAPQKVLEEICKSDRWTRSYRVRKALIFNPNTPLSYTMGLIPKLRLQDLKLYLAIRPNPKELHDFAKIVLEKTVSCYHLKETR